MARTNTGSSSNYLEASGIPGNEPLTLACWFQASNVTAYHNLISISKPGEGYGYRMLAAGVVAGDPIWGIKSDGVTASGGQSTAGYTANTWHHAASVYRSTTSRDAYLDGGSKGSDTTTVNAPVTPTITTLLVTRLAGGFFPLNGRIAWPCIWNDALSDIEISALGAGAHPLTIRPESIWGFWPLTGASTGNEAGMIGPTFSKTGTVGSAESNLVTLGNVIYPQFTPAASGFQPAWAANATTTISGGITA